MRPALLAPLLVAGLLAAAACGRGAPAPPSVRPLVVIGIDGADWKVIDRLWDQGDLPALKALAERGVTAKLATDYGSSPVIWTTIATGRVPRVHGITDFVVATGRGDVPVSSRARRVPALWNMASWAGRRVAVVGWWASWPAEEIAGGVVVSDRAAFAGLPDRVSPPSLTAEVDAVLAAADGAGAGGAGGTGSQPVDDFDDREGGQRQDRLVARLARDLAGRRFDLELVYFRSADIASHNYWKYFNPEPFADVDAAGLAAHADSIPAAYRAIDRAIGDLVAAAPADANLLVVSDHGFHAAQSEPLQLQLDLDAVFERLGYLARRKPAAGSGGSAPDSGVDLAASRVYTFNSPDFRQTKLVRFAAGREPGGGVRAEEQVVLRRALAADLARVSWPGGEPAFRVRDARPAERRAGADFVVDVRRHGAADRVLLDGRPLAGVVGHFGRISGTHDAHTAGIFLAAGPDVDPAADLEGIGIHDVAPTVLYAMGLPVGEDFAGRAWRELFTAAFQRDHPLRTVASWGTRKPGEAAASAADRELLDQLGTLGYLK